MPESLSFAYDTFMNFFFVRTSTYPSSFNRFCTTDRHKMKPVCCTYAASRKLPSATDKFGFRILGHR